MGEVWEVPDHQIYQDIVEIGWLTERTFQAIIRPVRPRPPKKPPLDSTSGQMVTV
jgi:hypothetical protein